MVTRNGPDGSGETLEWFLFHLAASPAGKKEILRVAEKLGIESMLFGCGWVCPSVRLKHVEGDVCGGGELWLMSSAAAK